MEIEAKFVVLARSTEDHLQRLVKLGPYELVPDGSYDLHDTYFDTSDHMLLKAGYAYRRRIDGHHTHLTLKGLGGVQDGALHQREEIEVIAPNHKIGPIGPLAQRLQALGVKGNLHILFELRQQRSERSVLDEGRPLGTLSLDRVVFTEHRRTLPFTELEFELGDKGEDSDLQSVMDQLGAVKGLSLEPVSKFSRGLVLAVGCRALRSSGAYALHDKDDVAHVIRKLFHPLLCKLLLHEFGTYRGEDIEELHDMQETAQRLRTLVRVFKPYLQGSDEARNAVYRLAKGFKRLTKTMGPVRNLDALRERTGPNLTRLPEGSPTSLQILARAWNGAYITARNNLICYLESERHSSFKATLEATLGLALNAPGSQQPIMQVIPEILQTRLHILQARAIAAKEPDASIAALHGLHTEIGRLRYTLEFLSPLLGSEIDGVIDGCISIQNHLKDLHDAAFACDHGATVRFWGTWDLPRQPETLWHPVEPAPHPVMDRYLETERQSRDRLRAKTPELWAEIAPVLVETVAAAAKRWRDKVS